MSLGVNVLGSGTNNTAGTSFNLANRTSAPAAGSTVVLYLTADNSATGGSSNDLNSVTDALGNTWTKRVAPLYDNGAASAGIQGAAFETRQDAGNLTTSTTVTVTTGSTCTAKAWSMYEITAASGSYAEYVTGNVSTGITTTAPTVTTGTITVGDVLIAAYHSENVNATTGDSDTTNGSWAAQTTQTVGSTTSGVRHSTQHKTQTTADSTQTFNPTTGSNQDCILSWVQYREASTTKLGAAALAGDATLAAVGGYIAPAVFSDDFETNDLSRWTTISQGQGTAYVSASAAKNGSFGIVISELSTYTQAGPNLRKTVTTTDTARMSGWFYTVTDGPSGNNNANLRLFSGGTRIVDVYRQNITGGLWLRYLDGAAASKYLQIGADGYASVAQWYQIDAYIKYAGAGSVSTIIAWVDGSQVLSRTDISLNKGSYDMLQIGAEHVSQHVNTWSDDIYINTAPSDPNGGSVTGAAALSADATLAGIASLTLSGAASLAGDATLAAAGGLTILGAANLSSLATLQANAGLAVLGAASLSADATLAVAAAMTRGAAASLAADATLAGVPSITLGGQAALSAAATLAAAGLLTLGGAASLSADATLAASGTIQGSGGTVTAVASLSALATMAATAGVTLGAAATLDGTATISPTAGAIRGAAASLTGGADVAAAAGLILGAIASLSADATLASDARRTLGFMATLDGTATIAPTAGVTYRSAAALAAQADLTAVGFTNNEPPSGPPPVGTILLLKIGR